jgi:hypothetical protein
MNNEMKQNFQTLLNTLVEEKHRIRSEITNLHKVAENRDSQINQLIHLLSELNTDQKIKTEQEKLSFLLTPKANSINPNPEKLKKWKRTIKKHRKSLAALAQHIKDELDVFQVCFLADIETIQSKIPLKPLTVKLFSEVTHEDINEDQEVLESTPEEIEISRIHFEGIHKKQRKVKK